jgi:hypothetical protein
MDIFVPLIELATVPVVVAVYVGFHLGRFKSGYVQK